jgi:hypothetical protein
VVEADVASSSAVPAPEADDPDSVSVALETASALWATGDKVEGLRWLRRAAEEAEQAGNDRRAVMLARTAADLTNELQGAAPIPPAVVSRPPAPAPGAPITSHPLAPSATATPMVQPPASATTTPVVQPPVQSATTTPVASRPHPASAAAFAERIASAVRLEHARGHDALAVTRATAPGVGFVSLAVASTKCVIRRDRVF